MARIEKPPAAGIAEGFIKPIETYAANPTMKRCLCGQEFQPSGSFLITKSPVLTITQICQVCAATLAKGSFAERGELARRLLGAGEGGQHG